MHPTQYVGFESAINAVRIALGHESKIVHPAYWQGRDVSKTPEMRTHELQHVSFLVNMSYEDPAIYAGFIRPNLPWADDHFEERVCGAPINPGKEWENWPYNKSAATHLEDGKFNHNYMERYWPKYAGTLAHPTVDAEDFGAAMQQVKMDYEHMLKPHGGIRYEYGDLGDVVNLLCEDGYTRQAYLPVWFPEDTGGGAKRAPCSIGYHFLMRDGKLDVTYQIRSCDFVRHFRDDIYLTVRLALWVINECRKKDPQWNKVKPGRFIMHISSLHVFANDYTNLFGKK